MKNIIILLIVCCFTACYDQEFSPKKRGYAFVDLPKTKNYIPFAQENYPYSFEYPDYGLPVKDSSFFGGKVENPYWMNIEFKKLGGKLHLTYKPLNNNDDLMKYMSDAFKMSYAHDKKASYIKEPEFHTTNNVHGIWYEVGGNAASAFQFFATDSVKHFIRGALYFDAIPNADSLAPVNQFIADDMKHFIETLKWTK